MSKRNYAACGKRLGESAFCAKRLGHTGPCWYPGRTAERRALERTKPAPRPLSLPGPSPEEHARQKLEILSEWDRLKADESFRGRGGRGYPDPDIFPLCDALNALPGVCTLQSCAGHRITSEIDGNEYIDPGALWLWLDAPSLGAFIAAAPLLGAYPLVERVAVLFEQRDPGPVVEILFHGNERGTLTDAANGILRFFETLFAPVSPDPRAQGKRAGER